MKIKKLLLAIALSIAVTVPGITQNTLSNVINN